MLEQDVMLGDLGEVELFAGDAGILPERARRVLVRLLKDPYLSAEKKPDDWLSLIEFKEPIKSALNDLFLDLFIDERNELAYAMPPADAMDDFPKLKQERELTEIQSLLIVFLRQRYASQIAGGSQKAWIDGDEMRAQLEPLYPKEVVNRAQASQTINSAIESIRARGFLEEVRGAQDRYRIMPILETVFSLERAVALLNDYRRDAEERCGQAQAGNGATDGKLIEDGGHDDGELV